MWQHHYLIHVMKMDALRAEAERERRWRLADGENGRPGHSSGPGTVRGAAARFAAASPDPRIESRAGWTSASRSTSAPSG